ncbi:MAG: hypothetical protein ACK5N7_09270 [Curvibacter sp.]
MARGTTVLKVKICAPSGLTFFSSDPLQIGKDQSDHQGFRAALACEVAGALSHRKPFDAFEGTLAERDIFFSDVPIQSSAGPGAPVEGVFELCRDVTVPCAACAATAAAGVGDRGGRAGDTLSGTVSCGAARRRSCAASRRRWTNSPITIR